MGRSADQTQERIPSGHCNGGITPGSVDLSALTIGNLSLNPTFDPDITEYTLSTTNATNRVTATPVDPSTIIILMNGEMAVMNGGYATWLEGENTLEITVESEDGSSSKTYTVIVTKS